MTAPDDGMGASVAANGKIYLMGGWDGRQPVNWVQAYDPSTNTWSCSFGGPGCKSSDLKPMPESVFNAGVTWGLNGTLVVAGGYTTAPTADVKVYDTGANSWATGPSLPAPTSGPGITSFPDSSGQSVDVLAFSANAGTTGESTRQRPRSR